MNTYMYNGPVYQFDRLIMSEYIAETKAVSKKKAICNIMFQAKHKLRLLPYAKIALDVRYIKEVD